MNFNYQIQKVLSYLRFPKEPDELTIALFITGGLLSFSSRLFRIIGLVLIVLALVRIYYIDSMKYYSQNMKYKTIISNLTFNTRAIIDKFKYDKNYKIFVCKNCGQKLRVPRKQGKITIRCKKCNETFKGKS